MYTWKFLRENHQEFCLTKIYSLLFSKGSHGTSGQEGVRIQKPVFFFFFLNEVTVFDLKEEKLEIISGSHYLKAVQGFRFLDGCREQELYCALFPLPQVHPFLPLSVSDLFLVANKHAWSVYGSLIYPQAWEMNPQSPASHRAGILAIAPGNTETLFPFPQDEIEVITIVPCFAVSAHRFIISRPRNYFN